MAILDFFNFGKKKLFKTKKLNDRQFEKNEQLVGLLNVREENTNQMFDNIAKYTQVRNELIRKGILEQSSISDEEGVLIINDFLENVIEQLPSGILVPIKTSFVYRGKEQILLIGNNIMTVGKFLKPNGTKPRHGMESKKLVGFFIDANKEFDVFNQTKNTRIQLSEETRPKLINLVNESIIGSKTANCRISNIEFTFKDWENSLECVSTPEECDIIGAIIEYLPCLDYEITTGISTYLHNETTKMMTTQEDNKPIIEKISEDNTEINKDTDKSTYSELTIVEKH